MPFVVAVFDFGRLPSLLTRQQLHELNLAFGLKKRLPPRELNPAFKDHRRMRRIKKKDGPSPGPPSLPSAVVSST
jgi:hypothetical protein